MAQGATIACPKGHASSESDYCSECGAKIGGGEPTPDGSLPDGNASGICPDCGTPQEQGSTTYCEVCGYNFATGAHGEVPLPEPALEKPVEAAENPTRAVAVSESAPADDPAAAPQGWAVTVAVDPTLRTHQSPTAPADVAPFSIQLTQPVSLIGRRNETRGIFPEIALDHDDAVSRRHALLQLAPGGQLLLRDIGAANGTRLNGADLQPMVDYPLKVGDEITLGHWSRIGVHGA